MVTERVLANEVIRPERLFAQRNDELDTWIPMGHRAVFANDVDQSRAPDAELVDLVRADGCAVVAKVRVLRVDRSGSVGPRSESEGEFSYFIVPWRAALDLVATLDVVRAEAPMEGRPACPVDAPISEGASETAEPE